MSMRCGVRFWGNCYYPDLLIWTLEAVCFRKCAGTGGFFRDFRFRCDLIFLVAEGFASADATRGQRKQTNVCDRPLETFALHSHVSWFLSLLRRMKGLLTKKAAITANILRCGMRRSPEGERKALWSPPQWRNPCAAHKRGNEKSSLIFTIFCGKNGFFP